MAERRMFAKSIINSARFLRMPATSRLLYYDLGMAADDDGVVEAFTVMRTTGAVEDDLRVLVSKEFVTILNDDLVSYITDWGRNNLIRKDRYSPSIYKDLLVHITSDNQWLTNGEPVGNQRSTQGREGQSSIGQSSIVEGRRAYVSHPSDEAVTDICFCFTDAFHVGVDAGFQKEIQRFLQNGLMVEDIKKTINSAKKKLPKQPIPYVIAALKSLQQLRKPVLLKEEDRPVAEWEKEWAEEFNALKKRMEEN